MATFDVFISYSSVDKAIADDVCAALEAAGIRCWIAPRNILASKTWSGAIVEAIDNSRAMVLVFSAAANKSKQIHREVDSAIDKNIPLVPMRIEDVRPTGPMAYFLRTVQWLDAFQPPVEKHFPSLIEAVKTILSESSDEATAGGTPGPTRSIGDQPAGPASSGVVVTGQDGVAGVLALPLDGQGGAAVVGENGLAGESVGKPSTSEAVRLRVGRLVAGAAALLSRRQVLWLLLVLAGVIAVGSVAALAVRHEMNADWEVLPPGTYLANMSASGLPVPAFASADRSAEKRMDIAYLRRIPLAGSKQLLARKRIWFGSGSFWFENWVRFPLGSGDGGPQAYVAEADVVIKYPSN
jgi:hypothetical protein